MTIIILLRVVGSVDVGIRPDGGVVIVLHDLMDHGRVFGTAQRGKELGQVRDWRFVATTRIMVVVVTVALLETVCTTTLTIHSSRSSSSSRSSTTTTGSSGVTTTGCRRTVPPR